MDHTIHSIGTVINDRNDLSDDFWGGIVSEIRLDPAFSQSALERIEAFSHLEIIYVFHKVISDTPMTRADRPRENPRWPETGIFAQRKKNRPNFIGTAMATLIRKEGASIFVRDLDAINGTPVMDIKPVMREFLPREPVTQPAWADELMENYWKERPDEKPVPIILADLINAIEDHCDFAHYYLDRETGEIIFQSERELEDGGRDDEGAPVFDHEEYRDDRFIPIEPMESQRGHKAMRDFIATLIDATAAENISRSIAGRKSFTRFKDILHNYPDLEKQWHEFSRKEIRAIAEEWLRYYSIHFSFVSLNDLIK
jgi:tRNA (adenine37-N6)-methyltransferase